MKAAGNASLNPVAAVPSSAPTSVAPLACATAMPIRTLAVAVAVAVAVTGLTRKAPGSKA